MSASTLSYNCTLPSHYTSCSLILSHAVSWGLMSAPWIQAPHNYKYSFHLLTWKQAPVCNISLLRYLPNTYCLTVHVAPFWHSCSVHSSLSNWHLSPSHPVVHTQLKPFTKSWNGSYDIPVVEQHYNQLTDLGGAAFNKQCDKELFVQLRWKAVTSATKEAHWLNSKVFFTADQKWKKLHP